MEESYRQITLARRADHIDNLFLLGSLVIKLPRPYAVRRSFVVMTIPGA